MEPWRANQTIAENRVRIGLIALATRWKLTKNPDYGRMMMGDLECGPGRAMWESSFKYERAFPPSFTMYLFTYQSRTHIHFATFLSVNLVLLPEASTPTIFSSHLWSWSRSNHIKRCRVSPSARTSRRRRPSPSVCCRRRQHPIFCWRRHRCCRRCHSDPIRCRSATAAPCEHSSLLPRRASPTECSLIEGKEEERRKHQP